MRAEAILPASTPEAEPDHAGRGGEERHAGQRGAAAVSSQLKTEVERLVPAAIELRQEDVQLATEDDDLVAERL